MVLEEQTSDYNCGIFSLLFLLKIQGYSVDVHIIPSEENGTSHDDIISFLAENKIPFEFEYNSKIENIAFPAIVNYQYEGDGHYGVALCRVKNGILLYNPAIGELEIANNFNDIFYSLRYGRGWHLNLK